MDKCDVPFEILADYWEGRLDAEAAARIGAHLASGCPDCARQGQWMTEFLPTLRQALSESAVVVPESATAYARSLARRHPVAPPVPTLRERIARLIFDSRRQLAAAGARGESRAGFQRLYETDSYYITLFEEPLREGVSYLIGQVYPRDGGDPVSPDSSEIQAADGATPPAHREAEEFHYPSLANGVYRLTLRVGREELRIDDLSVGL